MPNRIAVLSAAVGAALLALSGQVYAQATGIEVRLSGQVNRAILHVDDGAQSEQFFVDNTNSSTRFRLSATAPLTPGLRMGAVFEPEFQSNSSSAVSMTTRDIAATLVERHMDVFLEGGFGKVSLGQGDGASNGATEVDLSGTAVANWSGASLIGGGFGFRGDGDVFLGPTIGNTFSNQDFESRYDRVRYDTPKFGGFSLAGSLGSTGQQDTRELALWYTGDLGGLGRLAGAVGFSNQDAGGVGGEDDETIGGSVSWLHGSGFNVTLAHSQKEFRATGDEGTFTYAKLGYKFGKHAVSLDWGKGENQRVDGEESDMVGVGYVWAPVAWADIYAAVKRHSLDVSGAEDINIFMVGSRVKF
jgi:hypothetical protein